MSQVWYTGPIGKMADPTHGVNLGFEVRHPQICPTSCVTDGSYIYIACSRVCSGDVPTIAMVGDSSDGEVRQK